MGNESSTLSIRTVIYEQIKKKLFKKDKLKMNQSCQILSQHFICKSENYVDDNDDCNNEQWIDPADFITSSYKIESFYYDENYLDQLNNNEYENNNKTQNFKFKQNKLGVQNNMNDNEPLHNLDDNNNKDTDEHEEIIIDNQFQYVGKQSYESIKDNKSENLNEIVNNDLHNNSIGEYIKSPECSSLFQLNSSRNNIQNNTTFNNEHKPHEHLTTNIQNSIVSSLNNSNDQHQMNSVLVIQMSDLHNNYSYSKFNCLVDNVQCYVNSLKHDVSVQCDMCCKHSKECQSYENNVEKCSNVRSCNMKSTFINTEKNNYDKLIKLSQKIPMLSTSCNEIIDYVKQNTIVCSKVNYTNEEYLAENDSQSSQIYNQIKLPPNSYNDHLELNEVQQISDDTETNQNDQINHMDLINTSLQNVNHDNDEYEIISINNESISELKEPISVDVTRERYIYTPSITEKSHSLTTKATKISQLVNSRQSLKECMLITNYMSDENSSTEDNELEVGQEIRDNNIVNMEDCKLVNQNTSMITDNDLLGQSNTIQTTSKHTKNFNMPTYIQIVDSLHHDQHNKSQ